MRLRVVGTAALLVAVPVISSGLGLGDETVRSYLNAPLNAEIDLIATPDELASLRVQLASRDDFIRHGLDYPGFLSGIQVRTERLPDGRNIIRLTSTQALVEPFLVILVDVRSDASRLLREYTLLLDPPTFQPQSAPAAPVVAPSAGPAPGTTIRPVQPAPQPPAAPVAPRPMPAAAPVGGGGDYVVQRGDTLSRITAREYGEGDLSRAMIAIFRANPDAFNGNINELKAGATLDLPDQAAIAAISRSEAVADVRSHMSAWLGSTGSAPGAGEARLRLVPPAETPGAGDSSSPGTAPGAGTATPADSGRPVAIESDTLANIQQGDDAATPAEPPAPADGGDAEVDVADLGIDAPAAAEDEPAKPAEPKPATAAAQEPGSGIVGFIKQYWKFGAGGLAVLALVLALVARRRRADAAEAFAPSRPNLDDFDLPPPRDNSGDTFPLRKPVEAREPDIVVEETGLHERPTAPRKEARATVTEEIPAADSTLSATALEQGDPLAEADFHMAYGLYDQAADLVKAALRREPKRRDLKLKLLEVFFVWGNKDQFLQTARELADTRDEATGGEWEKVVIMGKQLAPEDELFHQSGLGAQTSVDLNLEGGQNLVDFDLPDDGSSASGGDVGVDLSLDATDNRLQSPAVSGDDGGLDFIVDDPGRSDDSAPTATTRQMAQPGLDTINAPTIEQPAPDIGDTLAGKLDVHAPFAGSPDQTAELALDDLGLDLGKLEATGTGILPPAGDETAGDVPTLVAGLDETSRELLSGAGASQRTEMLPLTDLDLGTDTSSDLDMNLRDTGRSPALGGAGGELDLDVGAIDSTGDTAEYQATQRIDPAATMVDGEAKDLEPVTMSEVGTKLDLARAYMDMGDPDGARSILNEVLQEGSDSQRQEAQRLLDSIPG